MGALCCPHCGFSNSGDDFVGIHHTEMTDDFYIMIFPYSYGTCRNCSREFISPAGPPLKMIDTNKCVIDYAAQPKQLKIFLATLAI